MFNSWKWLRVGLTMLVVSVLATVVLLAPVAGGKPTPPPPVKYTMTRLPDGCGGDNMNNYGDVVGLAMSSDGLTHAALWPAVAYGQWGPAVNLDALLVGLEDAQPYLELGLQILHNSLDINDSGQITGECRYTDPDDGVTRLHAFCYDPNGHGLDQPGFLVLPELGTLRTSYSYAINNSGLIAGKLVNFVNGVAVEQAAVVWNTNDNTVKTLQVPDGSVNLYQAYDVNDLGQVVCNGKLATTGEQRAVLYTPNPDAYKVIAPLGTCDKRCYTTGNGINNSGQVVGQTTSKQGFYAYTYTIAGGMVNLRSLSGSSQANAVNDAGQVVGWYAAYPFLCIPNTGMFDLWKLILNKPAGLVADDVEAWRMNNPAAQSGRTFGQILVYTYTDIGQAYVLTPDR